MDPDPVILIASVSAYERRCAEHALKKTGWNLCGVEDAEEAARACASHDGACVLLIDAGLLLADDPQWRTLRRSHPQLGAVVRSLIPKGRVRRSNQNTFLVHPDDDRGVRRALSALSSGTLR